MHGSDSLPCCDEKDTVKTLTAKLLVLLFVALVVQCAFDHHGARAATVVPSQGGGALCGALNAASVKIALPNEPGREPSSRKAILPVPDTYPLWTLARSIDHPPELAV